MLAQVSTKRKPLPCVQQRVQPVLRDEMERLPAATSEHESASELAMRLRPFILLWCWSYLSCIDAATLRRISLQEDNNLANVLRNNTGKELFVPPLSTAANLFCAQIIDHLDCFFWNPIRIKTTSLICIFGDVLLVAAPSGPSTSAFSLRPVFPAGSECNRLSPCFPRHTFLSVHSLVGILNDLLDGLSWMPVSKSDGRL